jgi:GT2 family glycosyltransferase
MKSGDPPDMSVVIVTPDTYETIRKTIASLQKQTVKDRLEIVIVAPSIEKLGLIDIELEVFYQFRVVEVGTLRSIGSANAAGIRHASTPVVALAEDHAFPDPTWAEALIKAHRQPWAAVGPAVHNGNPATQVSWADLFIGYGPWLEPAAAGVVDFLPGHNSSYKRAILLEYGPELEAMMEAETVLHWSLRSKGYQLYLEPAAKLSHLNFSRLSSWIPVQFHAGRVFAAARAQNERWSLFRRLLFTCGGPLIPLVRLWRIVGQVQRRRRQNHRFVTILPALVFGLVLDGIGQVFGYAFGAGTSKQKLSKYEFHRTRWPSRRDSHSVTH